MELTEEPKVRVAIIGGESIFSNKAALARVLASIDCEVFSVEDVEKVNGMDYDLVFLDDSCDSRLLRHIDDIPVEMTMSSRPQKHSRGKGKKYKDWDRRF